MGGRIRHVAITVPDLEQAEAYYAALFDMQLITREAPSPGGALQLPHDKDWDDVRAAGIELYMVALRRGEIVLALFSEAARAVRARGVPARPLIVGLHLTDAEVEEIHRRLEEIESAEHPDHDAARCHFRDRHGITWQLETHGEFLGNGDRAGRWLRLGADQD